MKTAILLVIVAIIIKMSESVEWLVVGKSNTNNYPGHAEIFPHVGRAEQNQIIEVTFSVVQKSIEDLASRIADPKSPDYGKLLTKEQVDDLTANPDGTIAVLEYLKYYGIDVVNTGSNGLYIKTRGPVSVYEKALNTQFQKYWDTTGMPLIRTHEYSLPSTLTPYVHSVSNIVDFPNRIYHGPVRTREPEGGPHMMT